MHELPITKSILNIALEELDKHKMKKVKAINLSIGELTGLVPDTIQYYFDIIAQGTAAEEAQINVFRIPVKIQCNECGKSFEIERGIYTCPACDSHHIKIQGGRDFLIDTIEME